MSNTLLDVQNLTMKFGGLMAIDNLSFVAKKDHITSIIGPNNKRFYHKDKKATSR